MNDDKTSNLSTKKNNFPQFDHLLKPLSEQAVELRRLNKELPETLRVPDSLFKNLDTTSSHYQMVENCEFYLAVSGGFKKTRRTIREMTKLMYGICVYDQFDQYEKNCYLHWSAADYFYAKPGIYRLCINFMANWNPVSGCSMNQIWQKYDGTKLNVGSLGDAALALQDPMLRRKQDGLNFPYFYHTDIRVPIDDYSRGMCSLWDIDDRVVYFDLVNSGYISKKYSAPTLVR
jgi:hypothetical protein